MVELEEKFSITEETYWDAIRKAEKIFNSLNLPSPSKPAGMEEEYIFPTDPSAVRIQEIGSLKLKLSSWKGYCNRTLAHHQAGMPVLEEVYAIILGFEMMRIQSTIKDQGRLVKEQLVALALNQNEDLQKLLKMKLMKSALISKLTSQAKIYDGQEESLSREISRREVDARTSGL